MNVHWKYSTVLSFLVRENKSIRLLEGKKGTAVRNSNYFNYEKCLSVHMHTYDPFLAYCSITL